MPVCADPSTSRPRRAGGIAAACTEALRMNIPRWPEAAENGLRELKLNELHKRSFSKVQMMDDCASSRPGRSAVQCHSMRYN